MAHPKPRRPKPGRGLPPTHKSTPEEEAEIERLIAEIEIEHIRLDAILIEKQAEAAERARIKALMREAEAQDASDLSDSPPDEQPAVAVEAPRLVRDLWF